MGAETEETPWESASNDQAFREQQTEASRDGRVPQSTGEPASPAVTSVRWDVEEDNSNNHHANNEISFLTSETTNDRSEERRSTLCWKECSSSCSWSYFLHVWDAVVTTLWILLLSYHLYYNKDNEHSRSASMVVLLVICTSAAVLNALRGILWVWASLPSLSTLCCCGCCFEDESEGTKYTSKFATRLTLWLAIVYGSLSIAAWFGHSSWLPWCEGFGPWCSKFFHAQKFMPIALTVMGILELFRWIYLQGKTSSEARVDRTRSPEYYNDDFSHNPSETSRHRPWWFHRHSRNDDGLRDPLLSTNGQPSWAATSWIPFGSPRRRIPNNDAPDGIINGDEEDVESVLDSLGEDWASRAESDPYWWTR